MPSERNRVERSEAAQLAGYRLNWQAFEFCQASADQHVLPGRCLVSDQWMVKGKRLGIASRDKHLEHNVWLVSRVTALDIEDRQLPGWQQSLMSLARCQADRNFREHSSKSEPCGHMLLRLTEVASTDKVIGTCVPNLQEAWKLDGGQAACASRGVC